MGNLVVSRKIGERIVIVLDDGRRITVAPFSVRGDKIRIGVNAPREITIHREEVQELVDNEQQSQIHKAGH